MEQPPKSFDDQQSSFLARVLRDIEVRLNNTIEVAKNISLPGAIKTANLANGSVTQVKLAPNVAGNGPVFSAHHTVANALPAGAETKVVYNIEDFDTNNNYNPTTSEFTPTVSGYYYISACIQCDGVSTPHVLVIYKNGVRYKYGDYSGAGGVNTVPSVDGIVFCNGTTDFIDIRCLANAASNTLVTNGAILLFQGCLIRAA